MERRVLLIILDGWGMAPAGPGNAISLAKTPNFDYYWSKYPHMKLSASGENVGLPKNQMGNSEVGHLNIGAGRIVWQDLPRITKAITDNTFFKNKVLVDAFDYSKQEKKRIHLVGLLSDGGVHSHEDHLFALLEMAQEEKIEEVYLHLFTDGRDVGPKTALKYFAELKNVLSNDNKGKIATVVGRFYAMDRDKRWERTELAYNLLTLGEGRQENTIDACIENSYSKKITDEFIEPTLIDKEGLIQDEDVIVFFNLRSDRPRQLCEALTNPGFEGFRRKKTLKNIYLVTMTEYENDLLVRGVAFPEKIVEEGLAEILSREKIKQLHIAETEKYAHVTYFFNGGKEEPFVEEDRLLIPSPKVKTYDLAPAMGAKQITDKLLTCLGEYQFVVVNYANPDMVGHTGNVSATIRACETVDHCLGQLIGEAKNKGYHILITADHGNAEKMMDVHGNPITSHTTNPVPLVYINDNRDRLKTIEEVKLGNLAPTILDIMRIDKPKIMTERSLLIKQ